MQEIIKKIAEIARNKKQRVYIVGGFLRNKILKRKTFDIDFIIFKDVEKFSKYVANSLKGSFINLSKRFGFYRVVIKDKQLQLDFAKIKGKSLNEDLNSRDFTINTLVAKVENPNNIIDKFNAVKDIKREVIREVSKDIFKFDPIRILRAIRFSANLKFDISDKLKRLIKKERLLLKYMSGERIRDELFKILEVDDCCRYLKLMDKLKILEVLFPEILAMKKIKQSPNHHLDVWNHSLETIRLLNYSTEKIGKMTPSLKNNIREYLYGEITKGRKRFDIIKFAALFHDVSKPEVMEVINGKIRFIRHENIGPYRVAKISKRIKLSRNEIKLLKILVLNHLRPGNLACEKKVTKRAISRFIIDLDKDVLGCLILSLADRFAARGKIVDSKIIKMHIKITKKILDAYQNSLVTSNLPKLISGDDLIKKFYLKEGPLIGKILKKVREAQIDGKITTRFDALTFAESLIKN